MYFCSMHHALIINTGFSAVLKIKQAYIGAICSCVVWVHILTYLQLTFFCGAIFLINICQMRNISSPTVIFTRGQFWPSGIVIACVCGSVCPCVCMCINHELVRMITHRPFKLGSPNLDHRCKTPWFGSLLFLGMIDRDLQGQI